MKKATERASRPENEEETAQRSSFSRPIPVEHLTSTARIPTAHLETILRNESGTRPVVSRDEILRAMEDGLDGAWSAQVSIALGDASAHHEDAHSRPTIDVFPAVPMTPPATVDAIPASALGPMPTAPVEAAAPVAAAPLSVTTPPPMVLTPPPISAPMLAGAAPTSLPRWLVPVAIGSVLLLVMLTVTIGFFLGRATGH